MRVYLVIAALALMTIGVSGQTTDEMIRGELTHAGFDRTYHAYVPASYSEGEPVVIAYHPYASSGLAMATLTGLNDLADERGFMVVYPNSVGHFWDDGRIEAGIPPIIESPDDIGFTLTLLDELAATYNPGPVYLTGTDSGGAMAYRVACEHPDRISAAAPVNTMMWSYHEAACPDDAAGPVDMLMIGSSRDTLYPLDGRALQTQTQVSILGVRETLSYWLVRNKCDLDAFDRNEFTASDTVIYTDCAADTQTAAVILNGPGHQWPRTGPYALNTFGIDASELIVDFFLGNDWTLADDVDLAPTFPRSYRYYVPTTYTPDEPMSLVMVLHGRPDNSLGIASITEFNHFAEEEGFIVVYPDGSNQQGWAIGSTSISDLDFLEQVIDDMSIDLAIDQVYLTGFSNGGLMTQYASCQAPDRFAAFAWVGATLYPGYDDDCEMVEPAPRLMMHGTADVSMRWEGDVIQDAAGNVLISFPVRDTVLFWAEANGCDTVAEVEEIPSDETDPATRVLVQRFTDCPPDSPFVFYQIDNGGHNWPGVPGVIVDEIAGNVTTDIHASQVIWEFFEQSSQ
jgi:polyhydroxybutyrate depolymerase